MAVGCVSGLLLSSPPAVPAVVAMSVSVKVRSLRVVVLSALRVAGTGIEPVLKTLIQRNLVDVAVTTITTVPTVTAVPIIATILIIAAILIISAIIAVLIPV